MALPVPVLGVARGPCPLDPLPRFGRLTCAFRAFSATPAVKLVADPVKHSPHFSIGKISICMSHVAKKKEWVNEIVAANIAGSQDSSQKVQSWDQNLLRGWKHGSGCWRVTIRCLPMTPAAPVVLW